MIFEYHKGKPLTSRKLTPEEKKILFQKLKKERKYEEKIRVYKLLISLVITLISIVGIVFGIKQVFF